MSKGTVSTKNKEMAAYMKAKGIRRTTGKCAICNKAFPLTVLQNHIGHCRG